MLHFIISHSEYAIVRQALCRAWKKGGSQEESQQIAVPTTPWATSTAVQRECTTDLEAYPTSYHNNVKHLNSARPSRAAVLFCMPDFVHPGISVQGLGRHFGPRGGVRPGGSKYTKNNKNEGGQVNVVLCTYTFVACQSALRSFAISHHINRSGRFMHIAINRCSKKRVLLSIAHILVIP